MKSINFKSKARIIRTLGDRLISGEVAAIIELVKNSYDADATFCKITIDPNSQTITIEDNGHGMTAADVEEKWAELGTENKHRNKLSRKGRKVLGDKGIGRLASAKLGRFLTITSTVFSEKVHKSIRVSDIDWNKFSANEDKYIEDISFILSDLPPLDDEGTILLVESVSTVWTETKLAGLVKELRKLISPIESDGFDFEIFLNIDDFNSDQHGFEGQEIVSGSKMLLAQSSEEEKKNLIRPFPLLDACDYTFEGDFFDNKVVGIFTIHDEKIPHKIEVSLDSDRDPCGSGLVILHIFDRDAESIRNTFVRAGVVEEEHKTNMPIRDARKALDELSGIAIYRNDFRVRPYGDVDADWLGLDKRRVQNPSLRLEQAQINGVILVEGEEASGLVERSSREGFEHNENFSSFKELVLKIFIEIEAIRKSHNDNIGKNRLSAEELVKPTFALLREEATFKQLDLLAQELPKEHKEKFAKVLGEHKTKLETLINAIQERQATLEVRSTLGFIMAEVVHEARHPTSAIGSDLISLKKRVNKKWSDGIEKIIALDLVAQFNDDLIHVRSLEALFRRLDPLIQTRRKRPQNFFITEPVKKSLLMFKSRTEAMNVTHNIPDESIEVEGLEVDISAAVINVIDNALYWLKEREIENPELNISYEDRGENLIKIIIEDNAQGIDEKFLSSIYNVGFTLKKDGSGLGLSIARESLGRAGGAIYHENTSVGSRFILEISKGE